METFWKNNRDLLRIFNRASVLKNPIFWKNRIFNHASALKNPIFWKNRIFNRASALKNPIFWKNRIFNRGNACTDAPRPATSKVCKTRPRPYSS
jgi:hypothetical protein